MPLRAEEGHGKGVFMEEKDMESMGMRLLETGRRGIIRAVFSRMGLVILLLLVQVAFLFCVFYWF